MLIDKIDAYILNKILADYKSFKNLDKQLFNKKISSFSNDILKLTEEFSKKSNVPDALNSQINELLQEIEKLKAAYANEQNTLSVHESKLNKLLLQENREYFDIIFYY
jgi:peptidoglycan hydrolase CwlO-like protein